MLVHQEIEAIVHSYPGLRLLPPDLYHALVSFGYPVSAEIGTVLYDAAAPIASFLLVSEGSIRATWLGIGRELVLYRVKPGEACIFMACQLLTETRYPVRGEADSAVRGAALPPPLFKQMVEQFPLFATFLFQSFAGRLTELLQSLDALLTMRLDQRLAGLLLAEGDQIQTTHARLADELGSVREVISRILRGFADKGLIELKRGQILILDKEALMSMHRSGLMSH